MNKLMLVSMLTMFMGFPAMANGVPDPEPEPEPPVVTPEPPAPPVIHSDGSEPWIITGQVYYSVCTCDELKTAWGFESLEKRTAKARSQCEQRRERIACPQKWK
jgi:hypothetical protein